MYISYVTDLSLHILTGIASADLAHIEVLGSFTQRSGLCTLGDNVV